MWPRFAARKARQINGRKTVTYTKVLAAGRPGLRALIPRPRNTILRTVPASRGNEGFLNMADYDNRVIRGGAAADVGSFDAGLRAYMLRVYNYMLFGLVLTGATAWIVAT